MGCGGGVKRGAVTCGCSCQTVFEGASIGQVFTGNVQLLCPYRPVLDVATVSRRTSSGGIRPSTAALLAVAVWEWATTTPGFDTHEKWVLLQAGVLCSSGVLHQLGYMAKMGANSLHQCWSRTRRASVFRTRRRSQNSD